LALGSRAGPSLLAREPLSLRGWQARKEKSKVIHWTKLNPFDSIYTFVDGDTGENCNIASDELRRWCQRAKPKVHAIAVRREWVQTFLTQNAINRSRLDALAQKYLHGAAIEPIIMCYTDRSKDEGMLVDGRHRYVYSFVEGLRRIPAYMLDRAEWHPFRISGLPSMTQEELEKEPAIGFRLGEPALRAKE
jgi:hypothetical protein